MVHTQQLSLRLLSVVMVIAGALAVPAAAQYWEHTVYVDSTNGEDNTACLTSESELVACATLQHVFAAIGQATRVVLLGSRHHMIFNTTEVMHFVDITLTGGEGGDAVVECIAVDTVSGAGFKFVNITRLSLYNVTFTKCSSLLESTTQDGNGTSLFRSAVYVLNSTNVSVEAVHFIQNDGVGLVLYDVAGTVTIEQSSFFGNSVPDDEIDELSGGGGLYIEHTYCTPGMVESGTSHCNFSNNPYSNHSAYRISNCEFADNHGSALADRLNIIFHQEKSRPNRLGSGGGLAITLSGASSGNMFEIVNCSFKRNSAVFGGGLSIHLHDQAANNTLHFSRCLFEENFAEFGGGGLSFGVFFYDSLHGSTGNSLIFEHINTTSNSAARYGGGTEIVSSRARQIGSVTNAFRFSDCIWEQNTAPLAAAVILAPEPWNSLTDGHLPIPVFINCRFLRNRIVASSDDISQSTAGVLYSSTFSISFLSSVLFEENNGSAISINSGRINVLNGTKATFTRNIGTKGGALVLLAFAHLRVFPKSVVVFDSNLAYEAGGAIYASATDELDFYISRSCFIRYDDVLAQIKDWDTHITFHNNSAGPGPHVTSDDVHICSFHDPDHDYPEQHCPTDERGQSIYTVSILPCWRAADTTGKKSLSLNNIFPHGLRDPFDFTGPGAHIATAPARLELDLGSDGELRLAPGEVHRISLTAYDDLNNSVSSVYTVFLHQNHMTPPDSAEVDSTSTYTTNNTVQINGEIGAKFQLSVRTIESRMITKTVNATLTACPPGLVYHPPIPNSHGRCICSATTSDQQYEGITKCNTEGSYGLLNKGYWAGCGENGSLLTSECPLGYCRSEHSDTEKPFYVLPKTCDELNTFLCGPRNRSGVLCGECAPNLTVLYHSQRFTCSPCEMKYTGWLLYIASELVPVTLVFIVVIVFNIHLTSGMWNGVIFFAQTIDLLEMNTLELYALPKGVATLTNIYRFIYGSFNFEFFKYEDKLAFCLKDRATALDVLAIRYATTLYAFLLLSFLILCFKLRCWNRCRGLWNRCQSCIGNGTRGRRHRSWIIHGISAFLVLSYAHCTKISIQILTWNNPRGVGKGIVDKVVFLEGTVKYFSKQHLPYAIPALVTLLLTTVPLIVFLVLPLTNMLLSLVLGEETCEKLMTKFNYFSHFKPLMDSFQGCYKDKYRFFAGVLFLYRFVIAAIFGLTTNAVQLYVTLELVLVVMLTVHAITQPNETPFYNHIDSLLLANLALVNGLTLFNYYWSVYTSAGERELNIALGFQVFFIYLPLLYMVAMAVLMITTTLSLRVRKKMAFLNRYVPMYDEGSEEEPLIPTHHHAAEDDLSDWPQRMFDEDRQLRLQHHSAPHPSKSRYLVSTY